MESAWELAGLSATEMVTGYRTGQFSPVEVHDAVLEVIGLREPTLNALCVQNPESRRKAEESRRRWEAGAPLSMLDGVPATVKENLAQAGVPLMAGSAGSIPTVPQRSSPVVERIQEAGGVIVGSTVMPDWGMLSSGVSSLHGITRSPWNTSWTSGGSSSGAAVAAAAGYAPLNVGTDIGGSIRLPAGWLGLAALKPSAGRIPLDAPYLGRVAGPLTRTVADSALFMAVLAQPDTRDWTSLPPTKLDWALPEIQPRHLRLGILLDAGCGMPATREVLKHVEGVAAHFEAAGSHVEPVSPFIQQELLDALDLFWRVRSWNDYRKLPSIKQGLVLPAVRDWCVTGADVTGAAVVDAYQLIMEMQSRTTSATEKFDYVLSPVSPDVAFAAEQPMPHPSLDRWMWHIGFTAPYNMSGQPAATINCGFTTDKKPVGVQISGRRWDDVGVLRIADWVEHTRPTAAKPQWPIAKPADSVPGYRQHPN